MINRDPDTQRPVLRALKLSATSADVRKSAKDITATATITDDRAGPGTVYFCLMKPSAQSSVTSYAHGAPCVDMKRKAGTAASSTWVATATVPKAAVTGRWNAEVWIKDASGNYPDVFWLAPESFAAAVASGWATPNDVSSTWQPIPGGAGGFNVVGTAPDVHEPVLTSVRLTPGVVNTAKGAVKVTADIAASDVEGVTSVLLAISGYPSSPVTSNGSDYLTLATVSPLTRVSGTAKKGVWRATFVIAGGTPDGAYDIQVGLADTNHFTGWTSSGDGGTKVLTSQLAPTGTRFVVANSR